MNIIMELCIIQLSRIRHRWRDPSQRYRCWIMGCIINFQELDEGNILQGLYVTFAQNIFKYVLLTQTSDPWGTSIPRRPYPKNTRVWVGSKSEVGPRCDWLKGSTKIKVIRGTVSRWQLPSSYSLPTNAILLGKPTSVKNQRMHGNSARNSTSWGNALLYPFFVKYVLEDEDGVSLQLRQSAVMAMPMSKWHRGVSSLLRLCMIDED